MSDDELFEFPCDFPLKVMGRDTAAFRTRVADIARRHAGEDGAPAISERTSRNGRYVALSITLRARSREHLDAVYRELTGSEDVLWVL